MSYGIWSLEGYLYPCQKPDCPRLILGKALYCCGSCSAADDGKYEIHSHASDCDMRWSGREQYVRSPP